MNNLLKIVKICMPIIVVLTWLLTLSFSMDCKMNQEMSEEGKMMYGFVGKTGKSLGLKYGMCTSGMGGGAKKEGIWLMSLSLRKYGDPLTEQTARKLIIDCANDFLEAINNDEQLRPFLKEYPFTAKNLDLAIHSFDLKGNPHAYPFIITVSLANEEIGYFTIEKSDSLPYKTEKYEPFEEGVAILKGEKKAD